MNNEYYGRQTEGAANLHSAREETSRLRRTLSGGKEGGNPDEIYSRAQEYLQKASSLGIPTDIHEMNLDLARMGKGPKF